MWHAWGPHEGQGRIHLTPCDERGHVFCTTCGGELETADPDPVEAWCDLCQQATRVEEPRIAGLT